MVLINGQPTSLSGSLREFVASGLAETSRYEYEVTIVVGEGAARREVTNTVWLAAGTEQTLAFDHGATATALKTLATVAQPATTNLILTVPADAEVWIAGQRTTAEGAVRRFSTTDLPQGHTWSDYEIRVVTNHGGMERSTVRTVTLTGGQSLELSIDPEPPVSGVTTMASTR